MNGHYDVAGAALRRERGPAKRKPYPPGIKIKRNTSGPPTLVVPPSPINQKVSIPRTKAAKKRGV
jgi:hypothetical protein